MNVADDKVALINGLVDFLLINVQQNRSTLKDYRVVPIHDLVKKLQTGLGLTTLSASLRASRGTLSDLTTVRRVSDATLTSRGNSICISLVVTLDFLELFFHKYILQVAMVKITGDMLKLTVKKNLIDVLLVLRFDELDCEMYFDKFKLLDFSDIDVDITGFSVLNPVARKVADWIVDYFNDFVVKEVAEPYAKKIFNSAINDKDFLRRLFGYAISGMVRGAVSNSNTGSQPFTELAQAAAAATFSGRPVAPLRQRRNAPQPTVGNRRNNVTLQNNVPAPPNNIITASSSQCNGPLTPRTPEVTVRNNLSRKNEIYIKPNKLFSSKVVDVDSNHLLPLKPTML